MAANNPIENNEISGWSISENNISEIVAAIAVSNENNETSETLNSADSEFIPTDDSISIESDVTFRSDSRLSQSSRSSQSRSMQSFQSLMDRIDYTIVEHEFVPGYRLNSSVLYAEEQFFLFNTTTPLGDAYLCSHKNCSVRLHIVSTNQCIRLTNCADHNHESKVEEYKKLACLNEIKRRCGELKHLLTGHKVTVRDIFNDVMLQ